MRPTISILLALGGPLSAQLVSPAGLANVQGNRLRNEPFGGYRNQVYQQIHGDLPRQARTVSGLGFRIGVPTVQSIARTVDMRLDIGDSDFAQRSPTFAANFVSAPTTAVARRSVALPDWTRSPPSYPGPFDAVIPFDAPWPYAGQRDLAWQITVFDNSTASGGPIAASYVADGFREDGRVSVSGTEVGTGCMAAGSAIVSSGSLTIFSEWLPSPQITLWPGFNYGARRSTGVALLGLSDPNASLPSLCNKIRVGNILAQSQGGTDLFGGFLGAPFVIPYDARIVGVQLHAQGASFDPARTGVPWTLSSGRTTVIPALPARPPSVATVFVTASSTATMGTLVVFDGMVTEFL